MKESDLIKSIQLCLTPRSIRLFRNNSGQLTTSSGHVVRYGVGSPGGSDLIGWTPYKITIDDVGKTIAVFTAVEVKTGKLKPTKEQLNFIDQVRKSGGRAGVAYSVEDAIEIIEGDVNGNTNRF